MTDSASRPWYLQLPAKLAAGVVFLVAVTTLISNLLELDDKRRARAASAASAAQPRDAAPQPVPAARPAPEPPAGPRKLRVAVERIAVEHDGSPYTTDWRFTVEADGEPLLAFQQEDLDDTGGRNVAVPKEAAATLRLPPDAVAKLSVKGWRGSRLRLPDSKPDARGEGTLSGAGGTAAVRVVAADPRDGAFVFYFSADAP
jgi:hypothetical protein